MPWHGDDTQRQYWNPTKPTAWLEQNHSFRPGSATPGLKAYRWGQKSRKLLRNVNIKKVFGFQKPNCKVYNISSFKNFQSVEELVTPRTSKQLSGPRGAPRSAGSGPGTQSAQQHQPEHTVQSDSSAFLRETPRNASISLEQHKAAVPYIW